MEKGTIYIIGKPDTRSGAIEHIRQLGYNVGLLSDAALSVRNPELFDRIEAVDFANITAELPRLKKADLRMGGLLCTYENYVVAKAQIGAYFNLPSISINSAPLCTDKALMRQAFMSKNPAITPAFTVISSSDAALAFAEIYGYPLILKPTNLVKSLLVLKCNSKEELLKNVVYAQQTIGALYEKYHIYDRSPQLLVEEFVQGSQYSVAAFVDSNGDPHFCDSAVRLTTASDMGHDDTYLFERSLPANLTKKEEGELFRVASEGVQALGMRSTPAHIELMYGKNGIKIIEIGARIGGYRPRMYTYSYGLDLALQEINLALDQPLSLRGTFRSYCAVFELFPATEGAFIAVRGATDTSKLTYYRETVRPGALIGPAKHGYKAAVIVIVTDPDPDVFKALCAEVATYSIEVAP